LPSGHIHGNERIEVEIRIYRDVLRLLFGDRWSHAFGLGRRRSRTKAKRQKERQNSSKHVDSLLFIDVVDLTAVMSVSVLAGLQKTGFLQIALAAVGQTMKNAAAPDYAKTNREQK
jgi:hypothetical protein